jgi:hypothetical protein
MIRNFDAGCISKPNAVEQLSHTLRYRTAFSVFPGREEKATQRKEIFPQSVGNIPRRNNRSAGLKPFSAVLILLSRLLL